MWCCCSECLKWRAGCFVEGLGGVGAWLCVLCFAYRLWVSSLVEGSDVSFLVTHRFWATVAAFASVSDLSLCGMSFVLASIVLCFCFCLGLWMLSGVVLLFLVVCFLCLLSYFCCRCFFVVRGLLSCRVFVFVGVALFGGWIFLSGLRYGLTLFLLGMLCL